MRRTLFRPEAAVRQQTSWYGQAVLLQPLSMRLLSWLVVLVTIATVLFLYHAQYTRRIGAVGVLAPDLGLIKVQAPHAGLVLERRAREGQRVAAGDLLYVISSEIMYASESNGGKRAGMTSTMLEQLRARQQIIRADSANASALAERERGQQRVKVASLTAEIEQLDQELAIQRERLASVTSQYERNLQAQAQGFLSPLALQQKYDGLLDQKSRVQSVTRARLVLARELSDAQSSLESQEKKDALARSQFELHQLDIEQDRVTRESTGRTLITAPQAGVVTAVLAEPGQRVDGQTLLTIVPQDSRLEAQLFVPSTAIGFIREGDAVAVHFAAFPFQKFGAMQGRVSEISSTTLEPGELPEQAQSDANSDPRYRVRIKLPSQVLGRSHALRSGMLVDAQFMQERRSLFEWILEPIYKLKEQI